ncbi:MAG TPA: glycosyltransferase family 39 protein [Candidatus Paceibacterota bacterium]|nr:glycosyltransferase family 39 protein [Candidatus Paceibacterota bacterium]
MYRLHKWVILMLILALGSGLFWNRQVLGKPPMENTDQLLYDHLAQRINQDGQFIYQGKPALVEPGYPFFLSVIYRIFGHNYDAVRVVQIILFALTIFIVFLYAKSIVSFPVAIGSGIVTAGFYGLANQAGLLMPETLFTFLLALFLYMMYRSEKGSLWWFFGAGSILAGAALTKGAMEFFIVVALGYIYYLNRKSSWRIVGLKLLLFSIGFGIILVPWLVKERTIGGDIAVAPRGGLTLLGETEFLQSISKNPIGHFIGITFGYYFAQKLYPDINITAFRDAPNVDKRVSNLLRSGKSYQEINSLFMKEAEQYIFAHPQLYLFGGMINLISLNSPIILRGSLWQNTIAIHPMFADGRHPEYPDWGKTIIILGIRTLWFLFLFLVIKGGLVLKNNLYRYGWIFFLVIYINFFYSALYAIPRFALPVYPYYFILAICGLFALMPTKYLKIYHG